MRYSLLSVFVLLLVAALFSGCSDSTGVRSAQPNQPLTVIGQVVDGEGAPLAGVTVTIPTADQQSIIKTSGTDGEFTISQSDGLATGHSYVVFFTSPGYQTVQRMVLTEQHQLDMGSITLPVFEGTPAESAPTITLAESGWESTYSQQHYYVNVNTTGLEDSEKPVAFFLVNGEAYIEQVVSDGSTTAELIMLPGSNTIVYGVVNAAGISYADPLTYTHTPDYQMNVVAVWDEDVNFDVEVFDGTAWNYYGTGYTVPFGSTSYGPEYALFTDGILPGRYPVRIVVAESMPRDVNALFFAVTPTGMQYIGIETIPATAGIGDPYVFVDVVVGNDGTITLESPAQP